MAFSYPIEKDLLERKLATLRDKNWLPPELLTLISYTAHAQLSNRAACPAPAPLTLQKSDAHSQGAPLLDKEAFPVHFDMAATLFTQLLDTMRTEGPLQEAATHIYHTLQLAHGDATTALKPCFKAILHDDSDYFSPWAAALPASPRLMHFLAYNSLVPSLSTIAAEAYAPNHSLWQHGHCPVCGSAPFFGYIGKKSGKDHLKNLHDTNGQRFHVCSFCRTEYRVKRLQCPFCLEEDHTKLEYFSLAEDSSYQVHVCHSCKSYIKIADFREFSDRPVLPALDDLACLPLDIAAQQQGFSRLTLSAWGF
ncbi:MAG: formate dehydrogenase accessory protein FdhE [Desulfovibrionaceae bacterium]